MRLNRKKFVLGLYDSDTGRTIYATKVVELRTGSGARLVLAYARAQRGPLVQITLPYDQTPRGPTLGMSVHFFLNEALSPGRGEHDGNFTTWARRIGRVGATTDDLTALILKHAPEGQR